MKPADTLLKALTSSVGARLAMAVLNYGLFWQLSHRLDGASLGGFSLLMNLFFLLQGLPLLGLSAPLARRAATEPGELPGEFSNAWVFALPVALLLVLGTGGFGHVAYPQPLHAAFWLLAASLLPTAWVLVAETALLGRERMSLVARLQCLESLGRLVLMSVAVWLGGDLTALFGIFLGLRCLIAVLYAVHPAVPRFSLGLVRRAVWRRNWAEVPVFLGIALLAVLSQRLDLILLAKLDGLEAAGVYAAAARLYEAALMLPTMAALVMLPALSRLYVSDGAQFRAMLSQALRWSLAGGLAVALLVAALAPWLIGLLYADHLQDAAALLRCLIFGAVLMTLDQTLSSTMIAAREQRQDLRALGLGMTVLVLGLVALVPAYGPLGAAIAVPLGLACRVLWRVRWAERHLELPGLGRGLLRAALAGGVGAAALAAASPWGVLAAAAAALSAYLLSAHFLGVIPSRAWSQARQQLSRLAPRQASH